MELNQQTLEEKKLKWFGQLLRTKRPGHHSKGIVCRDVGVLSHDSLYKDTTKVLFSNSLSNYQAYAVCRMFRVCQMIERRPPHSHLWQSRRGNSLNRTQLT